MNSPKRALLLILLAAAALFCAALLIVPLILPSNTAGQRDSGTAGQRDSGTASVGGGNFQGQPGQVPSGTPLSSPPTSSPAFDRQSSARTSSRSAESAAASSSAPSAHTGGALPVATVRASSGALTARPNDLGLFPRIPIGLEESVEISVVFPEAEPGELIIVQAEDGGNLDGGPPVARHHLDDSRSVRFAFRNTHEGGISRVTLRRGFDEKRLEFWGGPEPDRTASQ